MVVGAGRSGPTLNRTMPVLGTPEVSVNVPYVGGELCGTSCGSGGGKGHACAICTGTVVVGAALVGTTPDVTAPVLMAPLAVASAARAACFCWDAMAARGAEGETRREQHEAARAREALTPEDKFAEVL